MKLYAFQKVSEVNIRMIKKPLITVNCGKLTFLILPIVASIYQLNHSVIQGALFEPLLHYVYKSFFSGIPFPLTS